jgi:hypothetical protein
MPRAKKPTVGEDIIAGAREALQWVRGENPPGVKVNAPVPPPREPAKEPSDLTDGASGKVVAVPSPRQEWADAFQAAGPPAGDDLLFEASAANRFDRDEWHW